MHNKAMNYATVSSLAGLEAAKRAFPAGAVVAMTVADARAAERRRAGPVRDRARALGRVLTNPARLEEKIERTANADAAAAALHDVGRAMAGVHLAGEDTASRE